MRAFRLSVAAFVAAGLLAAAAAGPAASAQSAPNVRTYFIAADEIDWNYLPDGIDGMMGMKPAGYAKLYTQRGHGYIGSVYRKAVYREDTDATFAQLKAHSPRQRYLGLAGPIIHAEVGDTVRVVFRKTKGIRTAFIPTGSSTPRIWKARCRITA